MAKKKKKKKIELAAIARVKTMETALEYRQHLYDSGINKRCVKIYASSEYDTFIIKAPKKQRKRCDIALRRIMIIDTLEDELIKPAKFQYSVPFGKNKVSPNNVKFLHGSRSYGKSLLQSMYESTIKP
jgi:hypothetical protein